MSAIWWIRRDLRLGDNPALVAAAAAGDVVPLFVKDPTLVRLSPRRTARLEASLAALSASMGGVLVVRTGNPVEVLTEVAAEAGAGSVHVAGEFTPYAVRRDRSVASALAGRGVAMTSHGTPYAVRPGAVLSGQGTPYKVFTPFSKRWRELADEAPAKDPDRLSWLALPSEPLDAAAAAAGRGFGPVGEQESLDRWETFLADEVASYPTDRDRPDRDGTSVLSASLRFGEVHPRTMLHDLAMVGSGARAGAEVFAKELAWREFYADVLWARPETAWSDLRTELAGLPYEDDTVEPAAGLVEAWRTGTTGFPLVDAGMRQLLAIGWMHNRVRMLVASFLVKDLHVHWSVGAQHFLKHLIDGEVASNNHNWQWAAGTGTDAAPYFRVFNPVTQGLTFDPTGDYVRHWVPELRHLSGKSVHEPWKQPDGLTRGYPPPIVDHAVERTEALTRLKIAQRVAGGSGPETL